MWVQFSAHLTSEHNLDTKIWKGHYKKGKLYITISQKLSNNSTQNNKLNSGVCKNDNKIASIWFVSEMQEY